MLTNGLSPLPTPMLFRKNPNYIPTRCKGLLFILQVMLINSASLSSMAEGFLTTVGLQGRYFADPPMYSQQRHHLLSLELQPQFEWSNNNARKSFVFDGFARFDSADKERSHADIRNLKWVHYLDAFEYEIGISKHFWGVTESQHLVDIINQTDSVESFDKEEKLGQPLLRLSSFQDWGDVHLFFMPWFRERTLPGLRGRLRSAFTIDQNHAVFESGAEQKHLDWAMRWNKSISAFDIGVSYFEGTSRDPILIEHSQNNLPSQGDGFFRPTYHQIRQSGVDIQALTGALLIKHESVYRNYKYANIASFYAQTSGIEYTFYGVAQSSIDLGTLFEFLSQSRESSSLTSFDQHVFTGLRLGFNDIQSTEFLFGVVADLESSDKIVSVEGSRQLHQNLSATIEVRHFIVRNKPTDPFSDLSQDSFIEFEIRHTF